MPASRSLHKIVQFVLGIAQYLRGAVETLGAMCFPEVKNRTRLAIIAKELSASQRAADIESAVP